MTRAGALFAQIVDDIPRREGWPHHPEGFEDGLYEELDPEPDNGGYDEAEAW